MSIIFRLLEAPGVILHEFGHLFFCLLSGVKVYRIKLFGFKNPVGFVEHAEPEKFFQSLLISFGPLTMNSLIVLIVFSQINEPYISITNLIFTWIGCVAALHSIPSNGDASTLHLLTKQRLRRNPTVAIGYLFVGTIYVLNILKKYRLHWFYVALLFWLGNIYLK